MVFVTGGYNLVFNSKLRYVLGVEVVIIILVLLQEWHNFAVHYLALLSEHKISNRLSDTVTSFLK